MPSSQAETLSMQVDSPTASLCSQDRSIHAEASQRTIPLESQQSRSSLHRHLTNGANGARNSTAPASVVSVVDIVNYEINPGGGGAPQAQLTTLVTPRLGDRRGYKTSATPPHTRTIPNPFVHTHAHPDHSKLLRTRHDPIPRAHSYTP